ncbi:MAG: RraA family protein [Microbacteriaceae bacterium]|nr:RraA family protein [Microbacteriaceae bacterium]
MGDHGHMFEQLTTAHLADACVRAGVPVRCAPAGTTAIAPGSRIAGRVLPARHSGSVDVFLEALERSEPGDVLVVDNGGRLDEACVGDLITLEVAGAGLAGILIWGLHRDMAEIREIGLPVFSLGSMPTGPLRVDPRASDALDAATVGPWSVTPADLVIADDDGALFIPVADAERVAAAAEAIRDTEYTQAARSRAGESLRAELRFAEYLAKRDADPALTLRQHLTDVGGAIEV